jgi:hypothetical protein
MVSFKLPAALPPGKKPPGTNCIGVWVGHRASLEAVEHLIIVPNGIPRHIQIFLQHFMTMPQAVLPGLPFAAVYVAFGATGSDYIRTSSLPEIYLATFTKINRFIHKWTD